MPNYEFFLINQFPRHHTLFCFYFPNLLFPSSSRVCSLSSRNSFLVSRFSIISSLISKVSPASLPRILFTVFAVRFISFSIGICVILCNFRVFRVYYTPFCASMIVFIWYEFDCSDYRSDFRIFVFLWFLGFFFFFLIIFLMVSVIFFVTNLMF